MSLRTTDMRAARGAVAPSRLIALVVIVLVLAAGGWWFFLRKPAGPAAPGAPTAPGAATAPTAQTPTPTVSDELTSDELYREARKAMSENRMAAPAGNNALEYYLKIVAKDPDDSGAKDALRELFPFATGAAEDQINQGNFDEANRIIALLAKADPNNYSLTILRSKLDAKRKQADREQQQAQAAAAAAARQQAQAAAAQQPGAAAGTGNAEGTTDTAASAAAAPATEGAAPAAGAPAAADTATASTAPPAARPAAKPKPAPPANSGETHDATPITPAVPEYPITAARNRQEGWVEVEFTVAADGAVQNVHVVGSNPPRVFDHEAVVAVQRAKYSPRLENGTPVASTLRRRIEFKLRR